MYLKHHKHAHPPSHQPFIANDHCHIFNTQLQFLCIISMAYMEKEKIAQQVINTSNGIVKTSDFTSKGLNNYDVANLCEKGYITRLRHGFYQCTSSNEIMEEQILARLFPEAILCMNSALFYYGYSDFTPREWSIAVPRTFSRSRFKNITIPVKPYFIQPEQTEIGKTTGEFNGISLFVYDRERVICDCFKHQSTLDREIFSKALKNYAKDENKNLSHLSAYAKQLHVYQKVMNIMEVLLNE